MSPGDMTLSIDGFGISDYSIRTIRRDRQLVWFTVPMGVGEGRVEVRTSGGRASLLANVAALASPPVQPPSDAGETRVTAFPVTTKNDDRFIIESNLELRSAPNFDEDFYRMELVAGEFMVLDLESDNTTNDTQKVGMEIQNALGVRLFGTEEGVGGVYRIPFQVPTSGEYFVRVFDVQGVTQLENYRVHVRRLAPSSTFLSHIESTAATGTPAQSHLPSANAGQTIVLHGNGFQPGERVVFRDEDGDEITLAPISVAQDGRSMVVQLPVVRLSSQTASGMIRLESEDVGLILQVVPTLREIEVFFSQSPPKLRPVQLHGTGFDAPGSVFVGMEEHSANMDGIRYHLDLTGSPTGPIRVETLGGSSSLLKAPDLVSIQAVAASGTPSDPNLPPPTRFRLLPSLAIAFRSQ